MTQNTHNVRTRREQLSSYPETICVGQYSGNSWQLELDADDLDPDCLIEGPVLYVRCDIDHRRQKEAEARGAEEQRRKDGEGGEPVAWKWLVTITWASGASTQWECISTKSKPKRFDRPDIVISDIKPLYTRPANVAAPEVRVKKLEAREGRAVRRITEQVRSLRASKRSIAAKLLARTLRDVFGVSYGASGWMDDTPEARAALTCEGGV